MNKNEEYLYTKKFCENIFPPNWYMFYRWVLATISNNKMKGSPDEVLQERSTSITLWKMIILGIYEVLYRYPHINSYQDTSFELFSFWRPLAKYRYFPFHEIVHIIKYMRKAVFLFTRSHFQTDIDFHEITYVWPPKSHKIHNWQDS